MRLALGAGAHVLEALLGMPTNRQDVIRADEDVDFAHAHIAVLELEGLHYGEERIAVFVDLRPLVAMMCILDSELVKAELLAHLLELLGLRILQAHPDEAVGPLDVFADVLFRDVGELAALAVSDAVDEHERSPCATAAIIAVAVRRCHCRRPKRRPGRSLAVSGTCA
jgi:hypothetical protein